MKGLDNEMLRPGGWEGSGCEGNGGNTEEADGSSEDGSDPRGRVT